MKKNKFSIRFTEDLFIRFPFYPFQIPESEETVQNHFKANFNRTALLLSSTDLLNEINGKDKAEKKNRKLILSIAKYYLRAHSRATPYGLYAGMSNARWADDTKLVFTNKNRNNIQTFSCLDVDLMHYIINRLKKEEELIKNFIFRPNSTLYKSGKNYRYTETVISPNRKKYELSSFDYSDFFDSLFTFSSDGKTKDEIAHWVSECAEVTFDEASAFITELIQSEVFTDNYVLHISGESMLGQFEEKIELAAELVTSPEAKELVKIAGDAIYLVRQFDKEQINKTQYLERLQQVLGSTVKTFNPANFVQVNSTAHLADNHLSQSLQKDLRRTLLALADLNGKPSQAIFENFRDQFLAKYGEQKISLTEALDPENGILYGVNSAETRDKSPFISDLLFTPYSEPDGVKLTDTEYFLLEKLNAAVSQNESVIRISHNELTKKNNAGLYLPTIPVSFSVYKNGEEQKIHLHATGQSSGINTIARFHEQDERIKTFLKEINELEKAAYPGQIIAEIVHLPESRMGNVVHRPVFRDYDIPYLGSSDQDTSNQISVSDLFVCVENDEIRLYSEQHQKYVIPRLSNAHNYDYRSTPIYQFLCHLQFQNKRDGLYFTWGNLDRFYDHFPRVEVEGVIVSKEKWIVHYDQIKKMRESSDLEAYFTENKLPQHFLILEGDNYLTIDLSIAWSQELFKSKIAKATTIEIEEEIGFENSALKDENEKGIVHEFITAIHNDYVHSNTAENYLPANQEITRNFPIGSEWAYLKIFCGYKTSELVLTNVMAPLVEQLKAENKIDKWFFIRYNERGNHIRVRFHLTELHELAYVLDALNTRLRQEELDTYCQIEMATYEREIERYDPLLIEYTESLFSNSSDIALSMLSQEMGDETKRWKWAVIFCDIILNQMKFSLKEKQEICANLTESFITEHGFNKKQKKLLDKKFRSIENNLYELLTTWTDQREYIAGKYADELLFTPINDCFDTGKNFVDKWDYTASLMHMEINRIFRSNQRKNELVIYYILGKIYRSFLARKMDTIRQTNSSIVDA